MKTLPAVAGKAPAHQLGFPFNIRRGLGLWKLLYLSDQPVIALAADAPEQVAARPLSRRRAGPLRRMPHAARLHRRHRRRTSGWPARRPPKGRASSPTSPRARAASAHWSEADIAYYLETGFTPDFDTVGGAMVDVQKNIALLSAEDRAAIAAYLKAVPPHANGYPRARRSRREASASSPREREKESPTDPRETRTRPRRRHCSCRSFPRRARCPCSA